MATKIGDLFFDVYADVSRAVKNVDDFAGRAVAAGGAAAKAIGETIANAVGIAVGATALLTAATLSAGTAYNTLGQSASAAFTSIYNDVTAANEILQQISTLDLETPFTGTALTSVARTLSGFGFQLKDVVVTTEALAQATAAMGLGSDALHRMAIAFGQIQSRGKLAGDEARQLANYGIDAYGLLADRIGLTVAQVRELGEQGKLTSDFVIPALVESIQNRFSGATEALFNTAAGQAEGLRSILEGVGSAIVQPFIGFSGGGALVQAMSMIREELIQVVAVAEDGSFKLQGFLAPLEPILYNLADGVLRVATAFVSFVDGISDTALTDFINQFSGLGPVVAAVGAGLLTVFAQAIPFIGRFVAGFNPIVVAFTALILSSAEIRKSLVETFQRIWAAVQPLIPTVKDLLGTLMAFAEEAIPEILESIASAFEDLAPVVNDAVRAVDQLLQDLGPVFLDAIAAAGEILKVLAAIIGGLPSDLVLLTAAVYGFTVLLPVTTTGLIAMTSAVGLSGGAAALAATSFGMLATAIAIAAAAFASYNAISAGIKGDTSYLNEDVPFYEKPFQLAGRYGYGIGGGDRTLDAQTEETNRLLREGEEAGTAYANSLARSGISMQEFTENLRYAGLEVEANNYALIRYREILDQQAAAELAAAQAARGGAIAAANLFEQRLAATSASETTIDLLAEEIDLMAALKDAAAGAWAQVDMLSRAGEGATVDDFLASLPGLATDLTEALAQAPGILRDLDVSSSLNKVQSDATKVITTLAKDYGMSMAQIEDYFNERGLAGVIEALGMITEQTTETVDPLIAKYGQLGATTDQIKDALSLLEDQRQTRIKAEIDQVEAALRDAKEAAEAARDAVAAFLSGGYLNSTQQLIDDLIGNIGNIGSAIEDSLALGGVRGEAGIRSALGDLQGQLAAIVNAGLAEGLSGQQIVDMLAPVLQAINEEMGDGIGRIASLDWSAGITSEAGQRIIEALMSGMDPAAIQDLINGIIGADGTVAGLESQLEGLQASLQTEVEFSQEQVQAAIAEISATVTTVPIVTPEAAQLVFDAIQTVFDDEDLTAAVDQAVITQQILDAAQAAEDEISLIFRSGLSFNSEELHAVARAVSDEFYAAFTMGLQELKDKRAQDAGFESYAALQAAVGPVVAGAIAGGTSYEQIINNDIVVNESSSPQVTATEVIAASSAAAGTGGAYNPARYRPIRGVY